MTSVAQPQISATATTATRLSSAAGAACLAGGSVVVAFYEPTSAGFFPLCPFFAITGFACPGCGLTRGFHALFHGDWIAALDFNLLIPVWALIFGWVFVSLTLIAIRGKGLPMWPTNPKFMSTFFVVLISFAVLRNIPAWPFTILFP